MGKFVILACVALLGGILIVQSLVKLRLNRAERDYPPTGRMLATPDADIHVEITGTGPDLVLIHGASGNLRDFTFDLVDRLKDTYRVIAVDRPGLGHSTQPAGYTAAWSSKGEDPHLQARLIRTALDQIDLKNPLVLGHSFGSSVALAWALEYEDTAGLILLGGVSHPWPGSLNWQYPLFSSAIGGAVIVPVVSTVLPQSYMVSVISEIFTPQPAPQGYHDHVGAGLTLRPASLRANARQVNGLLPHIKAMAPDYPRLTLPIEILHGDRDKIVPLDIHSKPLNERVVSAHLTILDGVGHMPHHADPDAVVQAINRAASRAGLR